MARRVTKASERERQAQLNKTTKENRLQAIWEMRVLQKLSYRQIGAVLNTPKSAISRAIKFYAATNNLSNQTSTELISFYEKELTLLYDKRKNTNATSYAKLTRLVIDLQDKIAELCKLTGADVQVNVDQSKHQHYTVVWNIDGQDRVQPAQESRKGLGITG